MQKRSCDCPISISRKPRYSTAFLAPTRRGDIDTPSTNLLTGIAPSRDCPSARQPLELASTLTSVIVKGEIPGLTDLSTVTETGSFTPVGLMDLPQSVQIVTRELLDEQQTFQYADSATYLAGVERAPPDSTGPLEICRPCGASSLTFSAAIYSTNMSFSAQGARGPRGHPGSRGIEMIMSYSRLEGL